MYPAAVRRIPGLLPPEPVCDCVALAKSQSLWSRAAEVSAALIESGGTAGADRVAGGARVRFRCEIESSRLDQQPTLALRYDDLGNRWPWSRTYWELRDIAEGIAIGPVFFDSPRGSRLLSWYGLTPR